MNIKELTKALWMINSDLLIYGYIIESIKDGTIFFTNGSYASVKDWAKAYDEEYGE